VERGDTGPGRDTYGPPRRRRWGDRRAHGLKDDAEEANAPESVADADYGLLLRRPGEPSPDQQRIRQPDGPHTPQPDRFPPPLGRPAGGPPPNSFPPNGRVPNGLPPNGRVPNGSPVSGGPVGGGPVSGGPVSGGPVSGGPVRGGPRPGFQHRLLNDRRIPPDADRAYRPQTPGLANGNRSRPGPAQALGHVPGQDPLGDVRGRPGRPPQAPGAPPPRVPGGQPAYGGVSGTNGASGMGVSGIYGAAAGVAGGSGFPPMRENQGAFGSPGPIGARADDLDGWERPGAQAARGIRSGPVPPEPAGPVIRQRDTAVPDEPPRDATPAVASIAPDGLESFARDLRALRAGAELDYPEMAELSHFTMKTLAAAAGGLRLPTLPVAVAYVRACGGNVADWEERWQKLAAKITADAAKALRSDDEQVPPEPADPPASPEPPTGTAAAYDPEPDPGEIYVITSAKPRPPTW
jgi:hypothetical protein